jgi:U1 small nuclear ribonucleoprotein
MELELETAKWNPESNPSATGDAFKTLFVARLPYDANERDIEKEFDGYGKIRAVKLVKHSKTGKSRGYAFVEYDSTSAMRDA